MEPHGFGVEEPGPPAAYTANTLVHRLATCFDCFTDQATIGNTTVLFHRKAQLLADDLRRRFGGRDFRLNFSDGGDLTAGSDAETALQLRRHDIITLSPTLSAKYAAYAPVKPCPRAP